MMRHNQNKPFKCVKCSANFVSKGELISHNRTHTGDHPFVCSVCDTGFTTSSSLVISIQIFSGKTIINMRFLIQGETSSDSQWRKGTFNFHIRDEHLRTLNFYFSHMLVICVRCASQH